MNRDLLYVEHILEAIRRVRQYGGTGGRESFLASTLIQDAIIRNLQTLGESVKRLSPTAREHAPDVPYDQIIGFRNLIVHEYLRIDPQFVWAIVSDDLPALEKAVVQLREVLLEKAGRADLASDPET